MGKEWSVKQRVLEMAPDGKSWSVVTKVIKDNLRFEEAKRICRETGGNAFISCIAHADPEMAEVGDDNNQ